MSTEINPEAAGLMRRPLYAALFSTSEDLEEPYLPIAFGPQDATRPHGLDREMIPAIPALLYCLHLPNTLYELGNIRLSALKKFQSLELDLGHHIIVAPIHLFEPNTFQWPEMYVPTLAVCPDELLEETAARARTLGFVMGAIGYSGLSDETLARHWQEIHSRFADSTEYLGRAPTLSTRTEIPTVLPKRWLARQMNASPEEPPDEHNHPDGPTPVDQAVWHQVVLSAVARLENEAVTHEQAEERMPDALRRETQQARFPLVVAVPGVPSGYARRVFGAPGAESPTTGESVASDARWAQNYLPQSDADAEGLTIDFLVAHRSIARAGVGLTLPPVPERAFHLLAQLEDHMRTTRRPHVVWRMLRQLNTACDSIMTDSFNLAVSRASVITAFTNFPLGLLGLSGDTDPICCRVPMVYRPLMPLTASVQQELRPPTTIDLTEGLRVLIIECIPQEDPVGRASRVGWEVALEMATASNFSIDINHEDARSIRDISALVSAHDPHVLVLSAHGILDRSRNLAGVIVGEEPCLGPELGSLPPVVLLSACSVAPRGIGTVNIADMLLRQGAFAVLGAQIPVDVRHNATLMVRFLIYILESLARNEPHMTLLDAWHRARTTNAVVDILGGDGPLARWGHAPDHTGTPVLQRFMRTTSQGRLRVGHIYADSENVLIDMAEQQGAGARVRTWLRNPGYVPESLFYGFIGRPERVHLQHHVEPSS